MKVEFCENTGNVYLIPKTKKDERDIFAFFSVNHEESKSFQMKLHSDPHLGEKDRETVLIFSCEE